MLPLKPKKGEPKGWGWPAPSFLPAHPAVSLRPCSHSHPNPPGWAQAAARRDPGWPEQRREGSVSMEPREPWHGAALGWGVLGAGRALPMWLRDSQGGGRLHVACAGGLTPLLGSLGAGEPCRAQDTWCG